MRSFTLFLLLVAPLFASGFLKNVEIFKRTERVDILFTFEQSFDENIIQHSGDGYQTVIFKNTPFTGDVKEEIHSLGIQEIRIFGKENDLCLMILASKAPAITASKTTDGFGLRVRLKEAVVTNRQAPNPKTQAEMQSTTKSPKSDPYAQILSHGEYVAFVAFLFFLLLFLLFVRKRVLKPKEARNRLTSWLFKPKRRDPGGIEIIQEKAIDIKNRFITIESHGYRYLILIGASSNTLIDRYPITPAPLRDNSLLHTREEETFNKLLAQKKGQLVDYLEGGKRDNHFHLED